MEEHHSYKASEFKPDVTNVDFKPVGFGASGFGTSVIMYNKCSINLQTHALVTPFGFSEGFGNKKDYNLQINFYSGNPSDKAFMESLQKLEELIVQTAFDRRVEWRLFNTRSAADSATLEQVRSKFNKIVKPSKGDYPPTMKVSFLKDRTTGEIKTPCYDENNQPLVPSKETIPRRSRCLLDLQAKTIWVSQDGNFGLKWNIQKLTVLPPKESDAPQYVAKPAFAAVGPPPKASSLDDDEGEPDDGAPAQGNLGLPSGRCLLRDDDEDDD